MSYKDLVVQKVQLHCVKNNTEHRTDEIAVNRLIVRRGKPFQLTFHVRQPFRQTLDSFLLTVQTGSTASEAKGTLSTFGLQAQRGVGKPWRMRLCDSTATSFTVSVCAPSNASIGLYSLAMNTGPTRASLGTLIVLFNPWCEDDDVYLQKEEERREYVMNEQGLLYRGSCNMIDPVPWNFGQFEDDIIDICLKLLDVNPKCLRSQTEDYSARCSPVYVGRVVSAMINQDDADGGVLQGKWGDQYSDGVHPVDWNSSVEILRRWFKNACRPVKYGQCWVFAAVMCTVLRCLGIPCRVVTNFVSAHDTDSNLLVDEYIDEYGLSIREGNKDSVWNFHVWVEAWMKRPDISDISFYDGWQVLDPTPQETSGGVFCCGPAPVRAILEGHTQVKYDVPFVFAEVNADRVKWMMRSDGSKKKMHTDTHSVGQFISTKSVGSDSRLDITNQYKHREGSMAERDGFNRAVRNLSISDDTEDVPASQTVLMEIREEVKSIIGSDIKLNLTVNNCCSTPQALSLQINVQTMRYTGTPTAIIYKEQKEVRLAPNGELPVRITIPFANYGEKMLFSNSIKVSAFAKTADHFYLAVKDIVPQRPSLTMRVDETAVQFGQATAEVVFENPLAVTLRNCSITLTGSGLLVTTETFRAAQLAPGERMEFVLPFKPYRSGLRKLVADFQCSALGKIYACCNINILPAFAEERNQSVYHYLDV